jgi:hypothetical protein
MQKTRNDTITAIHPSGWPYWAFVELDNDPYTDSSWNGCDYRVKDDSCNSDGLAIDIFITGRSSKWNGVTYETAARISFPNDGCEPDEHTRGKVYSTNPLV